MFEIFSGKEMKHAKLCFKDVRFEYPTRPGEEALKGLNVTIHPQKMTAIVGDSGAGKSTIAKLLMRLYDPKSGQVMIGQHDLKSLDSASFLKQVAIVNQNPDLFNAPLSYNIAYGASHCEQDWTPDPCLV